jgi:serine/threonine-protein kinase RsbW
MTPTLIAHTVRLRLEAESRPETVAPIRSALSGLAETLGLDEELTHDLRTAVSEACNNVVFHAYDGRTGPMFVSLQSTGATLEVAVEDRGGGITQVATPEERMGVGVAVINALADRAQFDRGHDGGTIVRMSFAQRAGSAPAAGAQRGADAVDPALSVGPLDTPAAREIRGAGDLVVWLEPVSLTGPVLGRLLRATAAQSGFTLPGVSDLRGAADAIARYAENAGQGDLIGFAIAGAPGRLEVTAGPFVQLATDDASAQDDPRGGVRS